MRVAANLLGAFVAAGPDDVALKDAFEVGTFSRLALRDTPPGPSSPELPPASARARRPGPQQVELDPAVMSRASSPRDWPAARTSDCAPTPLPAPPRHSRSAHRAPMSPPAARRGFRRPDLSLASGGRGFLRRPVDALIAQQSSSRLRATGSRRTARRRHRLRRAPRSAVTKPTS